MEKLIYESSPESFNLLKYKFSKRIANPLNGNMYFIPTKNFARIYKFHAPIISLFTGAGGLDIGLEQAGFDIAVCIDNDKDCWKTIQQNRNWPILKDYGGDITKISSKKILEFAELKKGQAALVVGGAPCQPFSNIGKKDGIKDLKFGGLFQEFIRVVRDTYPAGFIFENVTGLLHKRHKNVIEFMEEELYKSGYSITYSVLNAADFGVPQKRKRVFVLGIRAKIKPAFPFPSHSMNPTKTLKQYKEIGIRFPWKLREWITVAEAFSKLGENSSENSTCLLMNISDKVKERMEYIEGKKNFKDLPDHLKPNCWKIGKHEGADTFSRLQPDEPSVTIRTCAFNPSKGRYIHPYENRGLNTKEMAYLQTFPTDWRFYGKLASVGRQIGNAVPPKLAFAIGEAMYEQLCKIFYA